MKQLALALIVVFAVSSRGQAPPPTIQDPAQLVGKHVIVQRVPLCQPATYTTDLAHAGQPATVVSIKPNKMSFSPSILSRMPPQSRAVLEDQMKAAVLLLQFDDGVKLDTCAPVGPKRLADYFELAPGETLEPVTQTATPVTAAAPGVTTPQECPVAVTKVSSTDGGFAHGLADAMTTSEFERQLDKTTHGGREKHYLDMRMRNNSQKPIRAIESAVVYSNAMGDESARDTLVSQNKNPIKPGEELKSYFMDRSLQSSNGVGDVTIYIQRIRFEDNTLWQDNGSRSCSLTSKIKQ